MILKSIMSVVVLAAFVSTDGVAQQSVSPAKGQSAEQQKLDESECYTMAKGQTGFDPAKATAAAPQESVGGERARGAVRGAVGGAAVGAMAGDAGKGAAVGAGVGVVAGGVRQRRKKARNEEAAAQQQKAVAQQQQNFQQAYGVCLESRGYTVR